MDLERSIARVLRVGIYASMMLLAVGFVLMLSGDVSPLAGGPALADTDVVGDVFAGRLDGILWLGIVVLVATPSGRVLSALVGYLRERQTGMVLVASAILAVIAASVALALAVET